VAIVGILLAAGRAARFGADKRLAILDAGDEVGLPIAVASCRRLRAAVPDVIAVVRTGDDDLARRLRGTGARVVHCGNADEGMGASLACGVRAAPDADGFVVALADMPWVQPATIAGVADALRAGASVAAPFHGGRRGHPVGFAARHRGTLLALAGDEGARAIVAREGAALVRLDVADAGVLRDVDHPDDLHPAQQRPAS